MSCMYQGGLYNVLFVPGGPADVHLPVSPLSEYVLRVQRPSSAQRPSTRTLRLSSSELVGT